jgi:AraC-like DNA-binding protein
VHTFVSGLQALAGHLDSVTWEEAVTGLVSSLRSLPLQMGPLALWTVRGLIVDAVERLVIRFDRRLPFELELRRDVAHATNPEELVAVVQMHLGLMSTVFKDISTSDPRVARALSFIWDKCTQPSLVFDDVARYSGLSRWHLSRLLVRETGVPYRCLLRWARMARAQAMLRERVLTMKQIAAALGYPHATEFDRQFRRTFGISPTEWLRRSDRAYGQHVMSTLRTKS